MKKKKNLLFKKLAVIFAAAFLVVQLVSCGDDDPLKGGNKHDGDHDHDNNNGKVGLINDLKDKSKDAIGIFKNEELETIKSGLSTIGKVSIVARGGRDTASTRLIFVIAQDLFGNDLSAEISKTLKDTTKLTTENGKKNLFVIIGGLKKLANKEKWKGQQADSANTAIDVKPIGNYGQLLKAAQNNKILVLDTATQDFVNKKATFGSVYYNDTAKPNLYKLAIDDIKQFTTAFSSKSADFSFNKSDIAIVAFDPFMSAVALELLKTKAVDTSAAVTNISAVTPIMSFTPGKTYTTANEIKADFANLGFQKTYINNKDSSVAVINADQLKVLAFDGLRISGVTGDTGLKNFFNSLVGFAKQEEGLIRLADKSEDHIDNTNIQINFALDTSDTDTATDEFANIKGNAVVLPANINHTVAGIKAIVKDSSKIITNKLSIPGNINFPSGSEAENIKFLSDSKSPLMVVVKPAK